MELAHGHSTVSVRFIRSHPIQEPNSTKEILVTDIIIAENLTKNYDNLVAVKGISFSVKEAEVFGFLGPNGAGKTTTMHMIQCVSPKTSGKLEVAGLDVSKDPRGIKMIVGVAPQETNLDPDFTVIENLLVYARYFGIPPEEAKERAERFLEFFQLGAKKDTAIDQLSGGMKKRLLLARSMLNEPRLLILDEPTVGLDPQARHLIWDLVGKMKQQGITIILTTHYMEEAAALCDRIVIMNNGVILTEGSPSELVARYVAKNVIEVKNSGLVLDCLKDSKVEIQTEIAGENLHIFTNEPQDTLELLVKACGVQSTAVRDSSLEDVFLKLTGRMLRE
jgi:lipooligosaccharide transport system ATP-binding protein